MKLHHEGQVLTSAYFSQTLMLLPETVSYGTGKWL